MTNNRKKRFPNNAWTKKLVKMSLSEDRAKNDITSFLVPNTKRSVKIIARQNGIVAGTPLVKLLAKNVSLSIKTRLIKKEGQNILKGQTLGVLTGPLRKLLTLERPLLNFLGALSGIATQTRRFVKEAKGTRAKIFDTRKTLPGYRALAKYAVTVGGGFNHRMGLHDMVLIKDNHLGARGISEAVKEAKKKYGKKPVEVEVDNFTQLKEALQTKADIILLDNMTPVQTTKAVLQKNKEKRRVLLEASGGITLKNIRAFAQSGVDRIAVGSLTHSAPNLDLSVEIVS